MDSTRPEDLILISVIIVNYNGARWMERCLQTLAAQTLADRLEIIISDNKSTDGSDHYAADWLQRTGRGRVLQNGGNVGFCEGNNIGARAARGRFLFFVNCDAWLEEDCLAKLTAELEKRQADAASPIVLDYDDDSFQSSGAEGIDLFGIPNANGPVNSTTEVFAVPGCSLLVSREMFERIGGFPPELFMYAEETDLGWRIWLAGGLVLLVPAARVHHRGAVAANPEGGAKITESR
ncbi:MAG TPA: glycosyltransferase family 2 protein, partial [Verrucomicrobiae bacterium]|nr:glycosyltransferase family 2 protein [Verrucomicrobiae bacterium]